MSDIDAIVKDLLKLSDTALINEAKEMVEYEGSFPISSVDSICKTYNGEVLDEELRAMLAVYVGLNKLGKDKKENG